jgi:hypothetical protein
MKRLLLPILAAAVLAGCGSSSSGTCIVLANGGNTLCGATAAAWCRSTDAIRALDPTNPTIASSVAACQQVESQYP